MARHLPPGLIPGYGLPFSSSESRRSRSRRGARVRRGYRGHRRPVSGSYGYRPTVGPGSQSELLTPSGHKVVKNLAMQQAPHLILAIRYAVTNLSRCYQRNGAAMPQVSDADLVEGLAIARRELAEALERQSATNEVLRVIASSPNDIQPVFNTIVISSARLCNARYCWVFRFDGKLIHLPPNTGCRPRRQRIYEGDIRYRQDELKRRPARSSPALLLRFPTSRPTPTMSMRTGRRP